MSRPPERPANRHPLAAVARRPADPPPPSGALGRTARTLGLLAGTSAIGWLLTTDLVSGPLTIPLTSLADLQQWLDDSTPAIVPAALLRLAALGVCAYLTLALVLTLLAQLVDRRTGGRAVHAVRRLLPAAVQRLVTGSAQCSLVAATAFPLATLPVVGVHGEPPGPTATMVKLDSEQPVATATMTRLPASAPPTTDGSPTTTVAPIAPTTAPTSLAPVLPPPHAPAPAIPSAEDTGTVADETWTVTPGDTFWSIAEEALTDRRGSFPTQHEIVRYWRQLIATNQPRLAAPSNPDLLLPGQSLILPPPS